ncbi:hypothetical protein KKA50_02020 [Patescibacteria group bacterium]|nr:hypothetical protein [Patescibacteria group bacterium]
MEIEQISPEKPISPENIKTAWNQANLVNNAIDNNEFTINKAEGFDNFEEILPQIINTKMFIELPPERLKDSFDGKTQGEALLGILSEKYVENNEQTTVLDTLLKNNVSLVIAVQEGFINDPKIEEALKMLNEKGMSPTLWIVLNDDLGYWTNKSNTEETLAKMKSVLEFVKSKDIKIEKIGLDYEPPLEMTKGLATGNITKVLEEFKIYVNQTKEKRKHLFLQSHLDRELTQMMDTYNVKIETYVTTKELRLLGNLLTFFPHRKSDIVPMAYTSVRTDGSEKVMTKMLDGINKNEFPAIGIVGNSEKTPGRDLRGPGTPEKHLSYDQLVFNFRRLLGRKNPFRSHYVFALDGAETLNKVLDARLESIREN